MRTPAFFAAGALLLGLAAAPAQAAEPALVAPGAPFRTFPADPPTTRELPTGEHIKVSPTANAMDCTQGPAGTVRGQFNRTEVEQAVDHHTEELVLWGSGVIAENLNEALGR